MKNLKKTHRYNSKFNILLLLITISIIACHINSTYINRNDDKKEGENFIKIFYNLIKEKNYDATYKLFSKDFFSVTDTQRLNFMYQISNEKLGAVKSYNVKKCETQAIIGTDSKINYYFLCDVKRSIFNSKETITFTKQNNSIKIISYHIDSKGL